MDTASMPKSRSEAKATGAKYYFTGEACKHGHIAPRKTKGACVECTKEEWRQGYVTRAAYFAAYNKSEAGLQSKQDYYTKNRDAVIARASARPEAEKNVYRKKWKEQNPDFVRVDARSRRSKHRAATPKWLTREQHADIRRLYLMAGALSKTTGEPYVVDHIVPLRSEVVCGLHVPWNLRVITREENLKKSNKLAPPEIK